MEVPSNANRAPRTRRSPVDADGRRAGRARHPAAIRAAAIALLALATALLTHPPGAARAEVVEPPLQELARRTVGADQGVFAVAGDGTVLVTQAADLAVHPASVTKIATTLALLERLGPQHRFTTRVLGTGPLEGDRLRGDLVVQGGHDPFFVYESALLLLSGLNQRGLRRVDGGFRIDGPFLMNWEPDPDGRRLKAVLEGRDGTAAWPAVARRMNTANTVREEALAFSARGGTTRAAERPTPLLEYRSPPLLHVVKVMNGYSNNVFHLVADAIGGPHAVQETARAHVPAGLRDEIVIDNGAGAGSTNRLSPRATVAILDALEAELRRVGLHLTDVLPVSGVDPGTLEDRFLDHRGVVVGKTGTFGSEGASALAGALRTRRFGTVRFAVLNHGVPVPDARARQDAFVRGLIEAGEAEPWPYTTPTRPDYLSASVVPLR